MKFLGIFGIFNCAKLSLAIYWYKSPPTSASYDADDILYTKDVRSVIRCASDCARNSECNTFVYTSSLNTCILLYVVSEGGPISVTDDTVLYTSNPPIVCPTGFTQLSKSKICVKYFSDYRNWNDSLAACESVGASLPVLNTTDLLTEFLEFMDRVSSDRVAVNGYLVNNVPYWSTGEIVDSNLFCDGTPDLLDTSGVCLSLATSTETWCTSLKVNRLDDATCSSNTLRICVKK